MSLRFKIKIDIQKLNSTG